MRQAIDGAVRGLLRAALLAPALTLGGCETINSIIAKPAPPPPCPRATAPAEIAHLTRFTGAGRDLTDVTFEAEVGRIAIGCDYDSDTVTVFLGIEFIASRGPADQERRAPFSWFIAVVKSDQTIPSGGRETFDSVIEFPGNQTRSVATEEPELEIPLREGEAGRNYRIYIGFELTEEELAFNRQQQP